MKKILPFFLFIFGIICSAAAQQKIITGTVTSATEGEGPLPGVTITVKGTTSGTITDANGKYSLTIPQGATTLIFSYIGMKTQPVDILGRSEINISLSADVQALNEVVVVALGMSREKKALGYAVQDIGKAEIARTGNPDLSGAIQGKIAGIEIKPSSGMPGASSQIVIRGARSFTGNNTPLYVIDGMPVSSTSDIQTGSEGDFSVAGNGVTGADISNRAIDINPADIETINVLKGQAAAALYGIRASNGVIVITTKSGKGNALGRPVISFSHNSTFSTVSRNPDYQSTWAQGVYGSYVPNSSLSWGPRITDLPDDPTYGGNANGHPGKFLVPQLEQAQVDDPWVTPQVFNNWEDYFRTGYSTSNNINVSQATENGNFALGLTQTSQSGIAPSTGMERWNGKANAERKLNNNFTTGFSSNFSRTDIDKLPSANDAALAGVLAGPRSYNLKGYPFHEPGDPYSQIYYRSTTSFDNPYWASEHYVFNEKTDRFFGNGYISYFTRIGDNMNLRARYQLGADTYTTHFQDVFEYGHNGGTGLINNYGISTFTVNSLATINYEWKLNPALIFRAMAGNEFNQGNVKTYSEKGEDFNFGGWAHIKNANIVTANESRSQDRTVGFFGSLSLEWKSMLYLEATGRNDFVSTMPTNNRSFFYPSVSLSFIASELEAVKNMSSVSLAKFRVSYAEVGQAGAYFQNFYTKPDYSGSWWSGSPITYPVDGVNSYIPNNVQFDPNLKPQNTKSYELGADIRFFSNRLGIDYTFSRQNIVDQIFSVPLAGSTGIRQLLTNGGKVHTVSHEVVLNLVPVQGKNFQWNMNLNFTKIDNIVDELAPGVESIFLGGFTTPQVRAGIGSTFPVIYGVSFVRDEHHNIVVEDSPGEWNHGMPKTGEPAVIGSASPNFILGAGNTLTWKNWSLNALIEWKDGGQMYSGSNGLLDLYGMSKRTEDRESTFIFKGVKPDGTPNDIVRGGPNDPDAIEDLYVNVLTTIDEYYIHDNSFLKLRELSLRYEPSKKLFNTVDLGVSVFARNILIWTALPNFDPESSQGNTNMAGSFERFSMPQVTTLGFSLDINF